MLIDPEEVEDRVVAELASSALFGARFRENAARALLIPRARPGKRTPLWQQRLKSQSLLEVARTTASFRSCSRPTASACATCSTSPVCTELLRQLHRREISLVEVETPTASPFASSLLFDYVATYMYEGDTPNAERRAAALSLDRDLLRELLGQEELRDLIDPGALAEVEADLQFLSDRRRRDGRDAPHDVLRAAGRSDVIRGAARVLEGVDAAGDAGRAASASGGRCKCGCGARSDGSTPPTPGSIATRSGWRRRAGCRPPSWRTSPTR